MRFIERKMRRVKKVQELRLVDGWLLLKEGNYGKFYMNSNGKLKKR